MPIEIVTDADVIQRYYRDELNRSTRCIPYGADLYDRGTGSELVRALALEPDRYVLYVSRMEPENNALMVVRAWARVKTDLPLVMVGDAPYSRDYIRQVHAAADSRVRFLGYQFGADYHALQSNARIYIHATEVGGTHPALVEAMGHRNAVVVHDVPEHREVVGDAGRYFRYRDESDLATQLQELLERRDEVETLRAAASARVQARYSWDAVADQYEAYFHELTA
jgi:glycosyltransferase involved in cell wall biosynthesis